MIKHLFLNVCFVFCLLASAGVHALENPETFTLNKTNEVLDVLRKNDALIQSNPNAIFDLVSGKVIPLFNFTRMTQLAIGKNWKKINTEQKKALVIAFKDILINTYREVVVGVKDYNFDVKSIKSTLSSDGSRAKVSANIVYQGKSVQLGNSLVAVNGQWRVYDVSVEGISFLSNYRSSFSQIIEREGVDALIKKLQTKSRDIKS